MDESNDRPVLTQKPNLPLIVAVLATVISFISINIPIFGEIFALIAFGAWFTWAWLEIFHGINVFRRVMGAVAMVLLFIVATQIITYVS